MAKGELDIEISQPADKVWAVVADFGGLDTWAPGVESCALEGDTRKLKMMGMEISEQLLSKDDAARSLSYSVVAGVPLDKHRVTITVHPAGDGSRVTWAYEVEPDSMGEMMQGAYQRTIEALKAHCEKG